MDHLLLPKIPKTLEKSFSTDDEAPTEEHPKTKIKTNIVKYKTEICKNYSEKGDCPYREKCQFAHGKDEIAPTQS